MPVGPYVRAFSFMEGKMLEPFFIEYGLCRDGKPYWSIEIPHSREWEEQYYALAHEKPRYPMPAIRTVFDVWGPEDTVSGKYELTGMVEYKRGHWRCFVTTDEPWRD
jgi:hypothetical protein